MELDRETKTGLNISAEVEVLSFTHAGSLPIQAVARVDLGSTGGFLSGVGGLYIASAYVGGTEIVPIGEIVVPAGKTKCIVVSKHIPISPGETLSLRVQGQSADTLVNTVATLQDATPLRTSDLYGGGSVQIDHNYGGADALAYRFADGSGVIGADVLAYVRSDYDAGSRGHTNVVARTMTMSAGRWARPLLLTPGDYKLVLYKPGQAGPDEHNLTVS
jgi:hypothetical protein